MQMCPGVEGDPVVRCPPLPFKWMTGKLRFPAYPEHAGVQDREAGNCGHLEIKMWSAHLEPEGSLLFTSRSPPELPNLQLWLV